MLQAWSKGETIRIQKRRMHKNALERGVCFKRSSARNLSAKDVPVMLKTEGECAKDIKLFVSITLLQFLDR